MRFILQILLIFALFPDSGLRAAVPNDSELFNTSKKINELESQIENEKHYKKKTKTKT
jgi:hypothetical protein